MDNSIVKVFHDSSEDCSILRNMYKSQINNTLYQINNNMILAYLEQKRRLNYIK